MFPIRAVEDDHVDRTGVEVQQCMKLTVTNSSIDFFVPIDYVHQAKLDEDLFCLHGPKALQTARQTIGDGLSSCMAASLKLECATNTGQRPSHHVMRPVRSPLGVRTKQIRRVN